jgi:hypothetical protein
MGIKKMIGQVLKLAILTIWETETGNITVQGQHGQKSLQDPVSTNGWVLFIPSYMRKHK